jgi:hypothetical protein
MRDGNEIPFTESKDGFLSLADKPGNHRIYMGDMNIYLESNKDYHYQLTYTTTTQIIPSGGIDILHYNIDGANWDLPMAQVTSIIHAPSRIKNHSFNQRRYHNDTQPLISQSLDLDETTITTTTNLPNPNLAVKFEFDPGFIQLSIWQKFTNLQQNNPWQFFGFFAILQLIIYAFLYIRTKNSITPHYSETPTIVQYYPPKDISPASAIAIMNSNTLINKNEINGHLLSTIYISLASKGLLKIKQIKTKVLFVSVIVTNLIKQFNTDNITLPLEEKAVYDMLWLDSEFTINEAQHPMLRVQSQRATQALRREFLKTPYFITFSPAVYRLVAFGLLMAPLNYFTLPTFPPETLFLTYFLMFWMLPVTLTAFSSLERRTQTIKDAASYLKGLKKFILATESNKFKIDPPPISPEYHNQLLPYAVALGCDGQWSDYLKDPINGSITRSHQSDSYISNRHIGTSSIASSISSAVAVSAPSNSSSGGDGGGGA